MRASVLTPVVRAGLLLGSAAISMSSAAQSDAGIYPNRVLRFIVPYAAGGNGDVVSRILASRLSPVLGQQVVIDNKAGSGGNIGAEIAARAAPDGYTIVLGTNTHAINMSLYARTGYDLTRDFAAVSLISSAPLVLIVHPSVPAKSVRELIALARGAPGQLNYGTGGSGSSAHITTELFKTLAGINIVHVPYKGVTQATTDLIAGQLQVMFNATSTALEYVRAKRVRAIGISSAQRSPLAPDIVTIAESGLPGFDSIIWQGVLAPAGTPTAIIERLNREIAGVLGTPEVKNQFIAQGVLPMPSTPGHLQSYMKTEIAKWAKVVASSGARVD